ncbi:S9 family peptidase [Bradyrhizobium sp. WSM3983]|uniref:alpha/beta hydrolase family protein n=1 Tax=Bradyrhizobium sp. WSM3983 TaxID=1038867 RepID=UPI000404F6C0|nr:alpha/beta hydrolase [Bradyrhizobium sp. WSM3983]
MARETTLIETQATNSNPHYEPYGWQHWPDHPWWSYQFRRGLGETQEGAGAISEVFLAASRMKPGDDESWHREWMGVAERNRERATRAEEAGHIQTAQNCWLRAAGYYRQAEFWLPANDPRRLATFELMEACSKKFISYLAPAGEVVDVPYEKGVSLCAYFVRSPHGAGKQPVLISMGGLDSIKDEMWFMQARGALQRGISVLMVDGPGQGGTLRRHGVVSRYDYEVPIGRCIDYLATRNDVDASRIAVCGSSLGGYYAARAGSFEPRLAACISHGAIWDFAAQIGERSEDHPLAKHLLWVTGAKSMKELPEVVKRFRLEGALDNMKCPYLIVHGGYDVLGVKQAQIVRDYAVSKGVDVTFHLVSEEETGADHCQHDNPTLGQEIIGDWLCKTFGIDEKVLRRESPVAPLI